MNEQGQTESESFERERPDYRVMWEEAARHALIWRARFETLSDAVDEYQQVTPGRRGYAAARLELLRVWLSVDDPDVGAFLPSTHPRRGR